jgi:Zn-finger nucleic acid-binding protein
MKCTSCGAPLPPNSTVCQYCQARNFLDLHGVVDFSLHHGDPVGPCPVCQTPLQKLVLATKPESWVDRCPECSGLFFPPGGIMFLLEQTVQPVYEANHELLENLQKSWYHREEVVYRKCPGCACCMNRQHFGYRSGVVVDRCMDHGDWLDGGEFRHLAEWRKAGGMLGGR